MPKFNINNYRENLTSRKAQLWDIDKIIKYLYGTKNKDLANY